MYGISAFYTFDMLTSGKLGAEQVSDYKTKGGIEGGTIK